MPHDKNGKALIVNDEVLLRAKVTQVFTSEDYCNVSVELLEPMHPSGQRVSYTLNSRQVELVRSNSTPPAAGDGGQSAGENPVPPPTPVP